MTAPLLLSALLLAAAPAKGRVAALDKLELGQREFSRGDFQAALKALDQAAEETSEPSALAKLHLLRGQVFAAQQEFARAEGAFELALSSDPDASLDPAKVDPALVKMLDGLRARLSGELSVRSDPRATIALDGRSLGSAPLSVAAPIGRHWLEARTADGRAGARREVVVFPHRKLEVELPLEELPEAGRKPYEGTTPAEAPRRPFADLRGYLNPFSLSSGLSLEVGAGFEWPFSRASLHAQVLGAFGLTARGALVVPVKERLLNASVGLELPLLFESRLAVGLGGVGGVEYLHSKWLGVFLELGARRFFSGEGSPNRLTAQLGTRLRLP